MLEAESEDQPEDEVIKYDPFVDGSRRGKPDVPLHFGLQTNSVEKEGTFLR